MTPIPAVLPVPAGRMRGMVLACRGERQEPYLSAQVQQNFIEPASFLHRRKRQTPGLARP
jgi:hypothetical protein